MALAPTLFCCVKVKLPAQIVPLSPEIANRHFLG
jgi:hypothetical protein